MSDPKIYLKKSRNANAASFNTLERYFIDIQYSGAVYIKNAILKRKTVEKIRYVVITLYGMRGYTHADHCLMSTQKKNTVPVTLIQYICKTIPAPSTSRRTYYTDWECSNPRPPRQRKRQNGRRPSLD
jgi:hypothetical protein